MLQELHGISSCTGSCFSFFQSKYSVCAGVIYWLVLMISTVQTHSLYVRKNAKLSLLLQSIQRKSLISSTSINMKPEQQIINWVRHHPNLWLTFNLLDWGDIILSKTDHKRVFMKYTKNKVEYSSYESFIDIRFCKCKLDNAAHVEMHLNIAYSEYIPAHSG